jgi:putative PIN family toxin of toxin-antitoxin system
MIPPVVLDTNVLVAGLKSSRGASYALLQQIGTGTFELNISVPLILEYEAVLKRLARELGLTHAEVDDVVDYVCSVASHREIFYLWRPFLPDPKDDMVLELAVECGATHIVTHNLRDFVGIEQFGIMPIRPGDFLTIL